MVGKVVKNGEKMVKKLVFGLKNWFLRKSASVTVHPTGTIHRLVHGSYVARTRSASGSASGTVAARTRLARDGRE